MKKRLDKNYMITIILVSLFAVSSLAIAEKMKKPDFERIANKLELTAEQKPDFIAVMKANHDKRKAFKKIQREQRKTQMEQYYQQTLSDLSEFLDDDQLAEFEQHAQQRKAKHEAKREERRVMKKS